MNSLKRNKRKLYLCQRDNTSDYDIYKNPIEVWINYREVSQELVVQNTGTVSVSHLVIKDVVSNLYDFGLGDRVYLNEPTDFDRLANDADYYVASIALGLDHGEVILKKMTQER